MRFSAALPVIVLALGSFAFAQTTAPACTGLCLQQVTCANNGTTSITGVVYAPNNTDPLPNVTVYIPNDVVAPFTAGVSCPAVGTAPSGSPLVGTETAFDGSFTLINVPVGSNIPLVIQAGRWRRQVTIPSTTSCANTTFSTRFPQNQSEGDIPKFAIASGAVDSVECVLRKVGIQDSEFTDPSGGGRINIFTGTASSGASISASTPTQASLMENSTVLNNYDVLMLPCQGTPNGDVVSGALGTQELANFVSFANSGGRIYSSHYSYVWMNTNAPFDSVANWLGSSGGGGISPDPAIATVDQSFTEGQTLAQWLQLTGASTTQGQISISTLKHDINGVIAPTQSYLTVNSTIGSEVMQFVFDTPVVPAGSTVNQCGRVLYNEYHVEAASGVSKTTIFPNECSSAPMTPQEKLLEFSLFELTNDGGQPSLSPTSLDFGSEAVGFTTPAKTFTWTNNSSFTSQVTSAKVTGDFGITSNNCASVTAGMSCQITVVFTPSALGARAGVLTVVSSGNTLSSTLAGTGTAGFTLTPTSLAFGNLDIGASASQTLTLTNIAQSALPIPPFVIAGPYSLNTAACGATVSAMSSCAVIVSFLPTTTGPLSGTLSVNSTSLLYSGIGVTLTGTGVDFSLSLTPTSGSVISGDATTSTATLSPIAGFAAPVSLTCTVVAAATASACTLATATVTPTAPVKVLLTFNTTSKYTVIGYGGYSSHGFLWLIGLASGWLLWTVRGRTRLVRSALLFLLMAGFGIVLNGCSGKLPTQNPAFTSPGSYVITLSATDGFLVRTATYTLAVTAK